MGGLIKVVRVTRVDSHKRAHALAEQKMSIVHLESNKYKHFLCHFDPDTSAASKALRETTDRTQSSGPSGRHSALHFVMNKRIKKEQFLLKCPQKHRLRGHRGLRGPME